MIRPDKYCDKNENENLSVNENKDVHDDINNKQEWGWELWLRDLSMLEAFTTEANEKDT